MLAAMKRRYLAISERQYGSMSQIERADIDALDRWFSERRGWRKVALLFGATTLLAWPATELLPRTSFVGMAVVLNLLMLSFVWTGLVAWFGYRKLCTQALRQTLLGLLGAIVGGVAALAGFVMLGSLDASKLFRVHEWDVAAVVGGSVFALLHLLLVVIIAMMRNREYRALAAHLEAEHRRSELSRQLAESKLRMLQLQIEPHFLFNTLASAQQLAERSAPEAARMIGNLVRFLRAATPALTDEATTLAQEASLIEAYLEIMKRRFGARLDYSVSIPEALRGILVPPGMLITLVENAIKHGIEPLPEGGRVDVQVSLDPAGDLAVVVSDTGAGINGGSEPGQGIGLANIRERLALLFGARGTLDLQANSPRGFVARLGLPLTTSSAVPGAATIDPVVST